MNLPAYSESCRGPCGDRQALETMHTMSKCKNAVLTFGSSFGSCITSVAGISRIYRVGRCGDCHVRPGNDGEPMDVNTKNNIFLFIALVTLSRGYVTRISSSFDLVSKLLLVVSLDSKLNNNSLAAF